MSDPTPVGDQGLWEACAMIALRDGTWSWWGRMPTFKALAWRCRSDCS